MKKKKSFYEKLLDYIENGDQQSLYIFGLSLFIVMLIVAFVINSTQDIGFQPEDEVCLAYNCNCDKASYMNTDDYTKCVSCRDIHCESWRDKTPEEREIEKCQKLVKDNKIKEIIVKDELLKSQQEDKKLLESELNSSLDYITNICSENKSLKPIPYPCRKLSEDSIFCSQNQNICYECKE